MWPTVAQLQQQQNGVTCHLFWYQKKKNDSIVCMCLHSSSDSSVLIYTCLVTCLLSSSD